MTRNPVTRNPVTRNHLAIAVFAFGLAVAPALAQQEAEPPQSVEPAEGITILFPTGSARVNRDQDQLLDQAARLFRDGNPVVMVVTGSADTVGDPATNLDLSIDRARAVTAGLADRGIPVDRLQVLGQGNSELPVRTEDEISNEANRSAQITWR